MKNSFKLFLALFLVVFALNQASAQDPTFMVSLKNIQTHPNGNQDSLVTFDIYVADVSAGAHNPFNYAAGQYWLNYNTGIGTGLVMTKIGSDLPPANQCPTFTTAAGRLGCSPNIPANNNVIVPSVLPGIKVLSLELRTSQQQFNAVPMNLSWRTAAPPPFTKLSYFLPDGQTVKEIPVSTSNQYVIDDPNFVLPVELASFTANVNRNNVNLVWSTSSETNNAGFDIERKAANSTEWTKIGSVNGNGTTTETKNYTFSDRPNTGTYNYRLKQNDLNGNFNYHALSTEVIVGVPSTYAMSQNYPNPFNPTTKIDFDLPYDGKVNIVLFDISGRQVGTLVNEVKTAGYYTVQFNASNLASGMYFYRISAEGTGNNFTQTKKMVLIK